jgi:OmpA-OmpF porin, OOP family
MKKIILTALVIASISFTNAQTKSHDWNLGLQVGTQEYSGDMGNEFFSFTERVAYGISVSKYLTPCWDVQGMVTFSNLDFSDSLSSFEAKFLDFNVNAKLKINNGKWLKENSFFQPYLFIGLGDGISIADHYIQNSGNISLDVNALGGIGFNFAVTERLGINIMSKYTYMWNDKLDNRVDPSDKFQDQAMMTTIGFNYNFSAKKDTDNDGISDKNDKCPTFFGLAKFAGCPDTDLDGVIDSEDACPTVAGLLNGCPDMDNDGIADKDDSCPEIPGIAKFNGCADTDGDGIEDSKDECPKIAGTINGCPDTDGDGVIDGKDNCPSVVGLLNGCPDTDKDGIADEEDKCPTIAGIKTNGGCPEVKAEAKKAFTEAMEGLIFQSGSSVIIPKSYSVLDNVAKIMVASPEYKLTISGYTDNRGDEAKNLALSQARAAAAKDYLIKKGVDVSRLTSIGYGVANPRADNETVAGRKLNRRVEFIVNF